MPDNNDAAENMTMMELTIMMMMWMVTLVADGIGW